MLISSKVKAVEEVRTKRTKVKGKVKARAKTKSAKPVSRRPSHQKGAKLRTNRPSLRPRQRPRQKQRPERPLSIHWPPPFLKRFPTHLTRGKVPDRITTTKAKVKANPVSKRIIQR